MTKADRSGRWLVAGGAILALNSAYLSVAGDPHPFYFANVLLHLALGLALIVPFVGWMRRRGVRGARLVSAVALLVGAALGVLLIWLGNEASMRPLLWSHIAVSTVGLLGLLGSWWDRSGHRLWRISAAAAGAALAIVAVGLLLPTLFPDPDDKIVNPPAPTTMVDEAMGGADGPFFPSSVQTAHGDVVPSAVYLGPESCARAGCHPDVYDQWESSAHHFSSFNNQWYRKSIEYMQEFAGVQPTKWCGGCHDPALLQSGMMDTPIEEIVHTPEAQAGLTCTACHMISAVGSTMGQGDYEITIPPLHDLATSEHPVLQWVHDFLVKVDPEPHRRAFIKPFYRGEDSAKYCSACHKVHLDVPVNSYRWIRGFNTYDNWQASGVSGKGARSFYYPPEPRNCIDCHMPRVSSDDAANKDGTVASHRFAVANTALPVANRDDEQLREVIDFLTAGQVTVDIFAMGEARAIADEEAEAAREGGALSTTFAVGEEQAMAVGLGGRAGGEPAVVLGPLDRVPATVRRGESTRIDVVVRTRGVGHFFPSGTVDAFDCWVELKAVDEHGRTVFWSGMADEDSPVEPGAHFYRSLMIDARGNPIDKRNAPATRAVVYVRLIPPGAADTVRFRLDVPPETGDRLTLTARLNYRKFSWFNTHWAYAGVPDPDQEGATFSPHFDDRRFVFTGDTSDVSGELKEIPTLPIVVMDEDEVELAVIDGGEPLPDMLSPELEPTVDRERFNDYGIGLLRQGDLLAAREAFRRVTEIEPDYVDGWVNLGRVALAEGDLDAGAEALTEAHRLDPDLARTNFFLGLREKALGNYAEALAYFTVAAEQYPEDRVVRNQMARVHFLDRDYVAALAEIEKVLAIDPEDLMAHYTAMLAERGAGNLERSAHHQALYERFKADEASQILTGEYRERHPHDNNERQAIHEHRGVDLAALAADESDTLAAGAAP
jgi:tetratricopeptide (TPR) repeat protein